MEYGYGNWLMALVSIIIFLFFIKSVFKPKTKTDWRTYKIFGAFIIALFTEMYGFPLTIYLLTSFFGNKFLNLDFTHDNGHILNTILGIKGDPHFNILHIISNVLIIVGLLLIAKAWEILYKSQKENKLAISGAYHYIRHPQYLGFILIIIGFLLQWPTLITLIMAPILIVRYIRLGKDEEKAVYKEFSNKYSVYKKETPAYFPTIRVLIGAFWKKVIISKTQE
ncbi:isoprenylcysteine carboxylmethyltransferase family protein [Candidatus Gottesmanbacteria bacterium]|nr:isoprenylcysteine carboxylmethyltransferase family protein [Candidatus Gottesmanbacteria bacterium]